MTDSMSKGGEACGRRGLLLLMWWCCLPLSGSGSVACCCCLVLMRHVCYPSVAGFTCGTQAPVSLQAFSPLQ